MSLNFEFKGTTLKPTSLNFIRPSTFGFEAFPVTRTLPFK